jgi:uncharacterized membrane protein YccC
MSTAEGAVPSWWQRAGGAMGFHVPVLAFALRTALAAFVALWIAYAIGLEHPHWAAMSAWASSQPMREHLLSRGIYRFSGSVVGVVFAIALVLVAQESLWVLAIGLAFWGGLCAFLGNLQRGYMVYGCMLAGYSAAMVVLLHHGPADSVWPLAWDRMFTVVTGVAAALCVSWCFAPRRKAAVLIAQSRAALAGVLQATAADLRQQAWPAGSDYAQLLSRLAQVEELLELYPEGSRTARNTSQAMHWQQHYALELVYFLGLKSQARQMQAPAEASAALEQEVKEAPQPPYAPLAQALEQLVAALQAPPQPQGDQALDLRRTLRKAIDACEDAVAGVQSQAKQVPPVMQALYRLLQQMRQGLRAEELDLQGRTHSSWRHGSSERLPLHRDWVGAREAAVRAGGALLIFGIVWAWTQASIVAFGMLGLSVMLLVFSAFESPGRTMAFVLRGQLIGAGLALLCQALIWPLAQSAGQMVWMVLPFALMGGLLFAHKRTAAGAMDINMAMFILLAPVFPDTASLGQHLSMALAVVSGPALAWVVYRWVYPTNAQRRMQTLARMMVQEVPAMAHRLLEEAKPSRGMAVSVAATNWWQAQLHHRLLRLVRWADKTQLPQRAQLPRMGLSLRAMQTAMLQLQQWRRETIFATPALRRTERLAQVALQRTVAWGKAQPGDVASRKARAAWASLAQQPVLPAVLAVQLLGIAQRDIPVLDGVRQALR